MVPLLREVLPCFATLMLSLAFAFINWWIAMHVILLFTCAFNLELILEVKYCDEHFLKVMQICFASSFPPS